MFDRKSRKVSEDIRNNFPRRFDGNINGQINNAGFNRNLNSLALKIQDATSDGGDEPSL
jgi:hypothetical protein